MVESIPGCFTQYPKATHPNDCSTCDTDLMNQCQLIAANKPKKHRYKKRVNPPKNWDYTDTDNGPYASETLHGAPTQ